MSLLRISTCAQALVLAGSLGCVDTASAQQSAPPTPAPASPAAAPQYQQSTQWATLPKMVLERQYAGPLQDTVIQRWSDPVDGTVCYIYLPISAPHSTTTSTGFVQYGSVNVGTISCVPGRNLPAAKNKAQPQPPQ
jgi:hypothetical protein